LRGVTNSNPPKPWRRRANPRLPAGTLQAQIKYVKINIQRKINNAKVLKLQQEELLYAKKQEKR